MLVRMPTIFNVWNFGQARHALPDGLHQTTFCAHHLLPVFGFTSKAIALFLLGSLFLWNTALLLPNAGLSRTLSPPAPCHEDDSTPVPASPHVPDHTCCLVGHNHALPAAALDAPSLPASVFVEFHPVSHSVRSYERRPPLLVDSGPPSDAQ